MFKQGDVVKIGNGSTRYTVLGTVSTGITVVQSHSSGKTTSQATRRLNLVQSVQDVADEAGCSVEELNLDRIDAENQAATDDQEEALTAQTPPVVPWPTIVSDEAQTSEEVPAANEPTSYQKAILFALNRLGKHVYGGTVVSKRNRRKVAKQARRDSRRAAKGRFQDLVNAEQAR